VIGPHLSSSSCQWVPLASHRLARASGKIATTSVQKHTMAAGVCSPASTGAKLQTAIVPVSRAPLHSSRRLIHISSHFHPNLHLGSLTHQFDTSREDQKWPKLVKFCHPQLAATRRRHRTAGWIHTETHEAVGGQLMSAAGMLSLWSLWPLSSLCRVQPNGSNCRLIGRQLASQRAKRTASEHLRRVCGPGGTSSVWLQFGCPKAFSTTASWLVCASLSLSH